MAPEHERWAEALAIVKWKGKNSKAYVAERIEQLAIEGSYTGVERLKEIAVKIDALMRAPIQ